MDVSSSLLLELSSNCTMPTPSNDMSAWDRSVVAYDRNDEDMMEGDFPLCQSDRIGRKAHARCLL